jgi:exonuclease III
VVNGIPIINSYVPQGYAIDSETFTFKLVWFRRLRRYFESALKPDQPAIWLGDINVAPEPFSELNELLCDLIVQDFFHSKGHYHLYMREFHADLDILRVEFVAVIEMVSGSPLN